MPLMSDTTSTTAGLPEATAWSRAPCISLGWCTRMPKPPMSWASLAKSVSGNTHSSSTLPGWLRTWVALVAPLFLVQGVVVVDDGDGVDAIAHRCLELTQVVPEAAVAGEAYDGTVGQG